MEVNNKYIRFDWAVKRMLRDKANFAVLEGLITVLTGEVVKIEELLESEVVLSANLPLNHAQSFCKTRQVQHLATIA